MGRVGRRRGPGCRRNPAGVVETGGTRTAGCRGAVVGRGHGSRIQAAGHMTVGGHKMAVGRMVAVERVGGCKDPEVDTGRPEGNLERCQSA